MDRDKKLPQERLQVSIERVDGHNGYSIFKKFIRDLNSTHNSRNYINPDEIADPNFDREEIVTYIVRDAGVIIGVVTGRKESHIFRADLAYSLPENANFPLAPKILDRIFQDFTEIRIIPIPLRHTSGHEKDEDMERKWNNRIRALRSVYAKLGFQNVQGGYEGEMILTKRKTL